VDLTLGPEEEFEPAYSLPRRPAERQHRSYAPKRPLRTRIAFSGHSSWQQ
jgi:hypothetical protein